MTISAARLDGRAIAERRKHRRLSWLARAGTARWRGCCFMVIALVALVNTPSSADAQDAAPQREAAPVKTHKFFDAVNAHLIVAEGGALLADGITTQYLRNHYGGREADPIARPFVDRGWPGMIVGGALFISAEVGARYLLHRHNHHRIERWVPSFVIAYGATGAIYNSVQIHGAYKPPRP
jgi:hypothetical protein